MSAAFNRSITEYRATVTPAHFIYFRAFTIGGVALAVDEIDLGEITPHVHVYVTKNLDGRCRDADNAVAIAELLLSGLFAPDRLPLAPDRIRQVTERLALKRKDRHGQGPFVLFVCQGNVEGIRTDELRELEGMLIGFNAVNKESIRGQFEDIVRSTLTSIALNCPSVISYRSVVDQIVLHLTDSRRVFSYTPQAGAARLQVNKRIDADDLDGVARRAALRTANANLARIHDLLLRSLTVDDDRLRAFLAAWTALEILVNKLFSPYEKSLFEDLGRGRPEPTAESLKRVQEVMSSRYRLRDKFAVIASALDPNGAAADLAEFDRAKKLRDRLSHGDDVSEDALPLEATSLLLRKYLALHVDRAAGPGV